MSGTRKQVQAVLFAAIMVTSMVAAGFAGGAAAQSTADPTFDLSDIEDQSPYFPGETVESSVELNPGSGYNTSANYSIRVEVIGPNGAVDLDNEEGFSFNSIDLSSLVNADGVNNDGILVDSNDDVVTVSGSAANNVGAATGNVNITAADDVASGEYTFSATVVNVGGSENTDIGDTQNATFAVTGVDVTPEEVSVGSIETIDATITDYPGGSLEYTVTDPSGNSITSGSTSNAEFSFAGEFDQVGDYVVTVSDSNGNSVNTTVQSTYSFNANITPANATFGDELSVDGFVVDGDGNAPDNNGDFTVQIRDEDGTRASASVFSDGSFGPVTQTVDDAGNWSVVLVNTADSTNLTDETVTVAPEDATLSANFEGNNRAFTAETYTFTLEDASGSGLDVTKDASSGVDGYLNVTGPFVDTGDLGGQASVAAVGPTDTDGNIEYVHLNTDADGAAALNATPADADAIGVSLEVDSGSDKFDGAEDTAVESFDSPDYVAGDVSLDVAPLDDLNVDTTVSPNGQLSVNGSVNATNAIDVTVIGSDNDGPGAGNDIAYANVTLSSTDYDIDTTTNLSGSDSTTFDSALENLDQAGSVSVEVVAYDGNDTVIDTYTESFDVDGDVLVDFSPTSATVDENTTVTVQLTNAAGDNVPGRTITLDGSALDSEVSLTGDNLVGLNPSTYELENVQYNSTGTVNLTVDDGNRRTVDVEEAITVTGDSRFELRTDDELLTTATDDVTFEVFNLETQSVENDSATLSDLADDLTLEQDGTDLTGFAASVDDAANGTILVEDVQVDSASTVNATAQTDNALQGSGTINVVEPVVETDLSGDLTEGVTTEDVTVTVTDPRDGSAVDNGTIQFTANGTAFNVSGTNVSDTGTTPVALDANGEAVVSITPDTVTDAANTTLDIAAQNDSGPDFAGTTQVGAGNLQIAERESGQDVELRNEVEFDSEEDVTFVLRDANGARIGARNVNVTGTSFDADTEEGFFAINFANEDLTQGDTLEFNVASDYDSSEITAATVDVTENLQEVSLNASVASDSVVQGNNFDFTVIRSDFSEDTEATLTFVNASGDTVRTTSTGAIDTSDYGVVDSSSLETGDYTVEVSKVDSDTKTFTNDTVSVTVTERITDVSLDPSTVDANTTVEHDLQFTALGVSGDGNTDTLVATLPASASFVDTDNATINVTDANGSEVSITGSPTLSGVNNGTNNQLKFDISPEQDIDATVDATFEVAFPNVSESTTADITLEVQDSTEGTFTATTPVTIQPADAEPAPTATVTFDDQTVENGSANVTVASANLSEGGFVAIHSTPVNPDNGTPVDTVVGVSEYLGNGTSENITVTLDEPLTENQTLVAMPHLDTNGNEVYDFVTSNGSADGPYTEDGAAVVDSASITVETVEGPGDITDNGEPATDLDSDGLYEDIDGDGELTIFDVQALFDERGNIASENVQFFDFDDNGELDIFDVQALFDQQQDA
ncbi:surface glycoprotein [Halorubrum sp. Atlit-28R]|uniref:beta strand repeat-containing protein n=1 Tax=Halorubrum sp. Atlit-28R TaxID=2282129 RepID=UPI000EF1DB8D|nr:surface glycoprotein [Halorubrum sp. Atlit-28R]RLM49536.1 hypothetical protein DVK06_14325 [Halorubrum sp. Atlit-28R]